LADIELGDGPTSIDLAHIFCKANPAMVLVSLAHIRERRIVGLDNKAIRKIATLPVALHQEDPALLVQAVVAAVRHRVNNGFRDGKTAGYKLMDATLSASSY
jgi:hypothetical protein